MSVQRPKMLNEKSATKAEKVLSAVSTVLLVILIAFTLFNLWFANHYFIVKVEKYSMNDTLQDGDLLYTRKGNAEAKRGVVVIVDVKDYNGFKKGTERIIKRLIAVEGDSVKCEKGVVYLKTAGGEYEPLNEPYVKGRTGDFAETVVGEGKIFCLGDNRENSTDCRQVGCLAFKDIIGVVPDWAIRIKEYSTKWEKNRKEENLINIQ